MKSPTGAHPPKLSKSFAVASERGDQWRQLNALARAWAASSEQTAAAKKAECVRQWEALRGLEQFWAYPGPRLMEAMAAALEGQGAAAFSRLVQKVSAALLSGDFRREEHVWNPDAEGDGGTLDTLPPDLLGGSMAKPPVVSGSRH